MERPFSERPSRDNTKGPKNAADAQGIALSRFAQRSCSSLRGGGLQRLRFAARPHRGTISATAFRYRQGSAVLSTGRRTGSVLLRVTMIPAPQCRQAIEFPRQDREHRVLFHLLFPGRLLLPGERRTFVFPPAKFFRQGEILPLRNAESSRHVVSLFSGIPARRDWTLRLSQSTLPKPFAQCVDGSKSRATCNPP